MIGRKDLTRRLALGGVAGPVGFATAWIVGSTTRSGYSMKDDAIGRLAASGASTRPLDVSPAIDKAHGVAASLGYLTLAATPFLAAPALCHRGFSKSATASLSVAH